VIITAVARVIIQWALQVMFPSACSFIVLVFNVFHYMFRPTWPSSGFSFIIFLVSLHVCLSACSFFVIVLGLSLSSSDGKAEASF
jgi:hypothetical protein